MTGGGDVGRFDAVVVGSGFGGSVTALRLAEAGMSVLVLERGRPYPPGSFARRPREMAQAFWKPEAGLHGLFEVWSFGGVRALVASGLGGGSLIYANVMLRKAAETFASERWPGEEPEPWPVTREELEPHYDRVEAMQRPVPMPSDHEPHASNPKTVAMEEAARAIGLEARRPPLAISFGNPGRPPVPGEPLDEPPDANLHGRARLACRLCGECDVGCNDGAKNSLDFTYLSAARRAGAQLRTCCEVTALAPAGRGEAGYVVRYRQHLGLKAGHRPDLLDPTDRRERTVAADRVVLAAGTLGSTRLLLANRGAFPGLSPALGTRFSSNGDLLAFALDCRDGARGGGRRWRALDPSRGPVITASIHVPADRSPSGREFFLQDAGGPVLSEWGWHSRDLPRIAWGLGRPLARRFVARLRGRADSNLGAELSRAFGDGRASGAMLPGLAMGRDVPGGRMGLRGDTLDVTWNTGDSDAYYDGVEERWAELAEALGGRFRRGSRKVTSHPLGGCPMGRDEREGVVDAHGRVFGWPGLVVADGSVLPGPVGSNPSFTIAALADRFAERLVGDAG